MTADTQPGKPRPTHFPDGTTITDPSNYAGLVHGVDEALETMGSR